MKKRVLFVCHGNICRSPMAEGMFRHLVHENGLTQTYEIDSAGTHAEHLGEAPDTRMRATANRHGITLTGRARQFTPHDFDHFDVIVAMDRWNRQNILRQARSDADRAKVRMLRDTDPTAPGEDVPDPWYGGPEGFEAVYQMVARASEGLLAELEQAPQD